MNARFSTALLVTLGLAGTASAEPKSWTAIKDKFPADAAFTFSIDVKQLRALPTYPKLVAGIQALEPDIRQAFDMVKSTCQIDLASAIADVSMITNGGNSGAIAVALDGGLDEAKVLACANKIGKAMKEPPITGKLNGKVTEYSSGGDKMFVAWLAKDVVVFDSRIDKRTGLDKVLGGAAPSAKLAAGLKSINTAAAGFGAAAIEDDEVRGGYGSLVLGKGTGTLSLKLFAANAKVQQELVAKGTKELKDQISVFDGEPTKPGAKTAAKILRAIKVKASGASDVTVDLVASEADVAEVLPHLEKLF
jgi:hypothetical protein